MKFIERLNTMKSKFLEVLFPKDISCISCGEELCGKDKYSLCEKCLNDIIFIDKTCYKCGALVIADSTYCNNCKNRSRVIERNYSACLYRNTMKSLIHKLKYGNARYLREPLGTILYDKYLSLVEDGVDVDIILPVPLGKEKLRNRGFNQVSELLKSFETDKIEEDVLVRIKESNVQARLSREERENNIKDAFEIVKPDVVKGKKVLLVDDVFTTGITIDECARILFNAGATSVISLTLAHSYKDKVEGEEESIFNDEFYDDEIW